MRYTRQNAESAFLALAEACGATVLDSSWSIDDPRREGTWTLDHNATYGGYTIQEIVASSPPQDPSRPQTYTAETDALDGRRRPAREFCESAWLAVRAVRRAQRIPVSA